MKRFALAVGLVFAAACGAPSGPKITSKEDVAKALNALAQTGGALQQGQGAARDINVGASYEVKGKTGTAKVTAKITAATGSGASTTSVSYDVSYSNFSADGENTFNGTLSSTIAANVVGAGSNTASGNVSVTMNGKVTISGEYGAILDVKNLAVTTQFATTATSASGSALYNGEVAVTNTLDNGTANYTFVNETVSWSAATK